MNTIAPGTTLNSVPVNGVALQLMPGATVPFAVPPARQPKIAENYGGVLTVANVPDAGPYQVTLSSEGWIDVIQDGKILESTAHSGKRGCADVRKSVRFVLKPGPLTVQISGAPATLIKLAILPAE